MALTDAQRLRQMLGESIPEGGTAADTMFTDAVIQDFLDRGAGDLDLAAYHGWVAKAAEVANLVTVQEGQSRLELSRLHEAALAQVKRYEGIAGVETQPRTRARTRRIVRR